MNIYKDWKEGKTYCETETKNSGVVSFGLVNKKVAKEMIVRNHYSKTWNNAFGKINIGVFKDGVLKGVASFGLCMNPYSFENIINDGDISSLLELNRLWISDDLGKNIETILISNSFKYIRNNHPEIRAIQSFADGRLGCGTIYKASNFKYYGYTKTLFFEQDSNTIYHKVLIENTKRPKSFIKLNEMFLKGELKPFLVKTYRYIYVLNKKDKKCITIKPLQYPKYDKGFEYTDYMPSIRQLCKFILFKKEKGEDFQYAMDYCKKHYTRSEMVTAMSESLRYFTNNKKK